MVTISDVAKKAKVSRATAARVLGGYAGPHSRTSERVMEAARELGYLPNQFARSLAKGRSFRVGVLVPDIENLFFARLFRGIEKICHQAGFKALLAITGEDEEKEHQLLFDMLEEQVEGIIIAPSYGLRKESRAALPVPVVSVDRIPSARAAEWNWVSTNNYESAQEAVQHLIKQGYSNILPVTNLLHLSSMRERYEGFTQAMVQQRLPLQPGLTTSSFQFEAVTTEVEKFLCHRRPDAIVAMDSILATAVVAATQKLRITLGEDIGLIAYDDEPWMSLVQPQITAIAQPVVEMGESSARIFLDLVKTPTMMPKHERLASRLIIRNSTTRKEEPVR
jgi:LacI family transcriptional regulator